MRRVGLFLLYIVMSGLLFMDGLYAEDNEDKAYTLEEVVVTATKSEKSILDAPGSIDVVSKDEIDKMNVKDVDEAIRMIPGVNDLRRKGFADIMPSINIRGVYGTDRNLILIDGQPVSEHVWRRFPLELVERIEVAKGPFSSLYGSNAMGGVVNIITKKQKDKLEMTVKTGFETNNSQIYEMLISGKTEGWEYLASARKRETDGYVSNLSVKSVSSVATEPTSGTLAQGAIKTTDKYGTEKNIIGDTGDNYYKDTSYNFKIKREFTRDTGVRIDYSRTDYDYGYKGGKSYLTDSAGNIIDTGTVYFYDNGENIWKRISSINSANFESSYGGNIIDLVNLSGQTKISDINLNVNFSYDKNDYWWVQPSLTAPYVQPSSNKKKSLEFVASKPLFYQQTLTVGAEIKGTEYEKEQYDLTDWKLKDSRTTMTQNQKGKTKNLGIYFQDEIAQFDPLSIYVGGRYDKWSAYDGYTYIVKSGTEKTYNFGDRDDDNFSFRTSFVYKLSVDSRIKASIGESYRGPTVSELYSGWESVSSSGVGTNLPNENLKPETVTSKELSFEKSFSGRVSVKAAYFYNEMNDYIYSKTFTPEEVTAYNLANYGVADYYNSISQKQNIGKSRSQGFEIELRGMIFDGLEAFTNITEMDTKVVENSTKPSSVGKKIPNIPERTFNVGIDYLFKGFSANITGRYVGKSYSADDNSDVVENVFGGYDSYFLVDSKISYSLEIAGFHPTLSINVDNMFDKEYYQYYLSPGRTWGVSLSISRRF